MAKCSVKPYEGTEKYVFISYAHRDSEQVFAIIERMAQDGYRIWYDEGIEPGSEWPESIAQHLNGCELCMAFLSPRYLDSRNCRQEIMFAISRKKHTLSVALEPVNMSLGMEMQLSDTQFIMKYTLGSEEEFFSKLYSARSLEGCFGAPVQEEEETRYLGPLDDTDGMQVRSWLVQASSSKTIHLVDGDLKLGRSPAMSDYVITGNMAVGRLHARISSRDGQCFLVDQGSRNGTRLNSQRLKPEQEYLLKDGDIIWIANEQFNFHQEFYAQEDSAGGSSVHPWLFRINTGEIINLLEGELKLGRSPALSDYVLDNSAVGRAHARIITRGSQCVLSDLHTKNKTWINGQELTPEKEYPLKDGDMILMATEEFQFHEK